MSIQGLRFGPITRHAVHAAIDMQRLFAEETEWASPGVHAIAPNVARICAHAPERTIFTRFLTPRRIEDAKGQWKAYYQRWQSVLAGNHPKDIFELVPELRGFAPPARVVDKYTHSAYEAPAFQKALDELDAAILVMSGVETEVCVLATALTAIDRGLRVILVSDAITSSQPEAHAAALDVIYPRFNMQVESVTVDELLAEWKP